MTHRDMEQLVAQVDSEPVSRDAGEPDAEGYAVRRIEDIFPSLIPSFFPAGPAEPTKGPRVTQRPPTKEEQIRRGEAVIVYR